MNILLMTNSMKQPDDEFAGKTDVVFFFAEEWAKAGHKVVVIHSETKFPLFYYKLPKYVYAFLQKKGNVSIPSVRSRQVLRREQNGIQIYRIPMLKLIPHSKYTNGQYKKQFTLITSFLSELSFVPDVITGHWIEPQLRLIHELGEKYNAKTGFVIHGELPETLSDEYKKYIKALNCFFLRSESMKRKTLSSTQKDFMPDHVSVCYSGIPDMYVEGLEQRDDWKKDGIFRIVYVGRLVAYKRIDAVLKALSKLSICYQFDIVGDGVENESLKQLSEELHISDKVVFHGRVSRDTVQTIMRKADCFVMISENEVFGLVYLEAMTQGCITIASINGGVDGIIEPGKNGFLCEQGDSDRLVELFRYISSLDKTKVMELRKNAYQTIKDFTDGKVAEKYLNDICEREEK